MGLGTLSLLSLLWAPVQMPADVTVWNRPDMKIPIDYHPEKKNEIRELMLYVSPDQGASWQQHAVAVPGKDQVFNFVAPADGTYWFNMVVVDKQGRRDPPDVFKAPAALKVVFDTKKPIVNITGATRVGDDVTALWQINERNPDWTKFKLEYAMSGGAFTTVATRPEADGSAQFKVSGNGPVVVRVTCIDLAGNAGEATRDIAAVTPPVPTNVVANPKNDNLVPVSGMGDPVAPDRSNRSTGDTTPEKPHDILPPRIPGTPSNFEPAAPLPGAPAAPTGPAVAPSTNTTTKTEPLPSSTNTTNYPPAQVINVTKFKLGFEVEDRGASGLGKAEVWVTRDEGRTWRAWEAFEKPESPLVVDLTKNNPQVEGNYGLKVVLYSGAGLARDVPKPGELPDLRIDVDTTSPIVKIYEAIPDNGSKDTMILRWQAVDRNLATDPITLEWSDTPRGPWSPVAMSDAIGASPGLAKRLPNTGSFPWKLPANFPTHQVYLKVTARDVAGNISEATTAKPILVDLNKPSAVKLNVVGGIGK